MNPFVTELLTSKKVVAAVSAIVTVMAVKIAGKLGVVLDADTANQVSVLVGVVTSAYLLSQGISDHGKEAAQINADAKATEAKANTPAA